MKLLNDECISSVASYHHNQQLNVLSAEPEVKLPSDDEGVFDLDLDICPETTDALNISTTVTTGSVGLNQRARAYPVKGRFLVHRAPAVTPEPKEQLVNLTQTKIKTIDEAVRSPDGLRNKVLLESALKRYKTLTHGGDGTAALKLTSIGANPHHVSAQSSSQQPASSKPRFRSDLIPILCHNRSGGNSSHGTASSCPSSPRKRTVSESFVPLTGSCAVQIDLSSAIKRLKASVGSPPSNYHCDSDMDISDSSVSCHATSPRKDQLFSDLASVFYRLKTQH